MLQTTMKWDNTNRHNFPATVFQSWMKWEDSISAMQDSMWLIVFPFPHISHFHPAINASEIIQLLRNKNGSQLLKRVKFTGQATTKILSAELSDFIRSGGAGEWWCCSCRCALSRVSQLFRDTLSLCAVRMCMGRNWFSIVFVCRTSVCLLPSAS